MNFFTLTLILHVILGLLAISATFLLAIGFFKREINIPRLLKISAAAFVFYALSWATAAYYYVFYYGASVKPKVLSGPNPWAHSVFMEWKEHVFLFLPFMSLAIFIAIYFGGDRIKTRQDILRALGFLSATIFILGGLITLSGVLISGSAQ